jgi:AcrR family transcriptional regulator
VVRAAYALVDRAGPRALSLAMVAAELGVRTPSLYNHVDGLPGLQRDLALAGTRDLERTLTLATLGCAQDEAVEALAVAYRTFVREHAGIYEIMLHVAPANRGPDPELEAAERDVVSVALSILSGYGLHGADALHAVRCLRSLVHGFATLEASGGFGLPLDVEESFRRLIELYVAALRPGRELRQAQADREPATNG